MSNHNNHNIFNLSWEQYYCKLLEDNIDLDWKWNNVSRNPNIDLDFVKRHINKHWNWGELSKNSFNGEKEKFKKNYIIQNCFPEHIPYEIRIKITDLI